MLVHHAQDKCAFVKANCPDEEAGLFSYLQLYYCNLPKAKSFAFILMLVWLSLLFSTIGIAASDFLSINLGTISTLLGMSESLAGVTFLAFGNGSPDVFSTFAAMGSHSGSLAIGELLGAACFITAVVSGSMAIVRPFKVAKKSFIRDVTFFAVAAAFSMVFLADGHLHLWECAVMIGFYVFYVVFVVVWHWYMKRLKARKAREAAARSHFNIPARQELEINVTVDDEDRVLDENDPLLQDRSFDEFAALEAANTPLWKEEEPDEDDETRDRQLAELRSQMRLNRPRGERRNTLNPIRPSLLGALEFRSALSRVDDARGGHSIPINLRRYSGDSSVLENGVATPRRDYPAWYQHARRPSENILDSGQPKAKAVGRGRAVSANDALGLKLDTSVLNEQRKKQTNLLELPSEGSRSSTPPGGSIRSVPLHDSADASISESRGTSPHGLHLMPPEENFRNPSYQSRRSQLVDSPVESPLSMNYTSKPLVLSPLAQDPDTTFPPYTDSPQSQSRAASINVPPPSISAASLHPEDTEDDNYFELHKVKWWPYKYLPPPQTIFSALFPTIYHWHGKTYWDKLLGLATAPSLFILTITLPVVEDERSKDQIDPQLGQASPTETQISRLPDPNLQPSSQPRSDGTASKQPQSSDTEAFSSGDLDTTPREWNRWLVILQIFTAPFFVVLIIWANIDETYSLLNLLYMVLGGLGFSLICLTILLVLTWSSDPKKSPKYRPLLCFLGFFVAISWIATIANEVVGVLKAFGVILGISDAILGLTIFAVGNSLGDLVADITVARLGFPMMALSACFGGPMLNILLGIGVSGIYVTIRSSEHKHEKHPDRPIRYKPYAIDVSTTLIISGVTLLLTLLGLLVLVPLNKWKMDRRIGWGLITLWTASTISNVIVEVLGVGENI